jgi:hypothetical protein
MIQPIKFASDVQFVRQNGYYLCYRPGTHAPVIISFRLKEAIEQKNWSQLLPEDLDEMHSLCELGFAREECGQ